MRSNHKFFIRSLFVIAICFATLLCSVANASFFTANAEKNIEELKDDSTLKVENGYLKNIKPQSTVRDVVAEFKYADVEIFSQNGELAKEDDLVGSGFSVRYTEIPESSQADESKIILIAVVKGDVTGEGEVDSTDYLKIKGHLYKTLTLEDEFYLAADTDESGEIDSSDYIKTKGYFLSLHSFDDEEQNQSSLSEKKGEQVAYSDLEKKDLGGREIFITERWFGYGNETIDFTGEVLYMEDDEGNLSGVNQAKKDIIDQVQKDYNCVITGEIFGEGSYSIVGELRELITVNITAGTGKYDFFFESYNYYTSFIAGGMLARFNEFETINLKSSCWDQNAVSDLSICNLLFFLSGDINTHDDDGTTAMLFNKNLYDELGYTEDLYELVRNREWTFDKLVELSQSFESFDTNSDGVRDEHDTWFMGSGADNLYAHCVAAGEAICTKDEKDVPQLSMCTNRTYKALSDAVEFYISGQVLRSTDDQYYDKYPGNGAAEEMTVMRAFLEGRELFYMTTLNKIPYFRQMEDAFGILPVPMYSSDQENYVSTMTPYNSSVLMIPNTHKADDNLGTVIQALAELSEEKLIPEYYEKQLRYRDFKDEESAEMLDIIFNNRHYDLGTVFSTSWNRPDELYQVLDTNVEPRFKQQEAMIDMLIQSTVEDIQDAYDFD